MITLLPLVMAMTSPFWGDLPPGPHRVGMRLVALTDAVSPPVQVLWIFPTGADGPRWTLGSLVDAACVEAGQPSPPANPGTCREAFVKSLAAEHPGLPTPGAVLERGLAGVRDAEPLDDRRPVILFDGGLRSDALSYFALAEYLASHGYVSLSLPSLPLSPGTPLTFDRAGIEAKARQVARVSRLAAGLAGVDVARLAVAAWSVGGVSTAIVARQMPGVRALISLDGGLGYDYGPPLARQILGGEAIVRVPVLHITGTLPNQFPVPKTFDAFEGASTPHAYLAHVEGLNHSHFVARGGVVAFAGVETPAARAFWRANDAVSRLVLLFANSFVDSRDPADTFVARARAIAPGVASVDAMPVKR